MIQVGSIVRVITSEFDLENYQGKVVGIADDNHPDGPVEVSFGQYVPLRYFGFPRELEKLPEDQQRTARFKETELQVEDGWDVKHKAEYHYPNYYHTLYERVHPFINGGSCELKGCEGVAVCRIITNVWGVVCEYDVCEKHADMHGKCMEVLDIGRRIEVYQLEDIIEELRHAL